MKLEMMDYVQSIVELIRQAEALDKMIRDGIRRWGGGQTKILLQTTCEAILADARAAADAHGDTVWLETQREFAVGMMEKHGINQTEV